MTVETPHALPSDGHDGANLTPLGPRGFWYASTWKPGQSVNFLRDNRSDTFWQSNGATNNDPHKVTVEFDEELIISRLSIFMDFEHDDSYTPEIISILAGDHPSSLHPLLSRATIQQDQGWVHCDLYDEYIGAPIEATVIQLLIHKNRQNGKDTHIRQMRLYGPRAPLPPAASTPASTASSRSQ